MYSLVLRGQAATVLTYHFNPAAKDGVIHTMNNLDPKEQAANGQQEEAMQETTEQTTEQQESAEEGGTEG